MIQIFIDCEFTDFINTDLISIAAVTEDGREFYGENLDFRKDWSSEWVKENIYPLLKHQQYEMSRIELAARLWSWIEELNDDVTILMDYATDWELMDKLFDNDKHPNIKCVKLIDELFIEKAKTYFAMSILGEEVKATIGMNNLFSTSRKEFYTRYVKVIHFALDDANANRYAYSKVQEKFSKILK